jgi:ABC-2 type transport system permease protein
MTSMFANRTPFLWAVLPIAMVLLIESLVVAYLDLNSSFIAEALVDYLQLSSDLVPGSLSSYESPKTALFSALLGKLSIVATLIGCIFMYLTYWLRINRTAE